MGGRSFQRFTQLNLASLYKISIKMKSLLLTSLTILITASKAIAQDWPNLEKYHKQDSLLTCPKQGENRVVFMGNSITEAWAITDTSFFSNSEYINRGISGQTSPQMLLRFRADVIKINPSVVVISAGTNDIAGNTGPSSIDMIMDNIISMAQLAKANDIAVVLASVLPVYDYPWKKGLEPSYKILNLNVRIKEYADKNNCVYLDYYSALVDDRRGFNKIYTYDGVHPNLEGYKVMEPLAIMAIHKALSEKRH